MSIPGLSGISGAIRELPNLTQVYSSVDSANRSTYTFSNVPIGDPHPDRRLLMYFVAGFLPGTLNYSCTVNGEAADFQLANLANGTVLSSAFSSYVNRDILYTSKVIPTGTTATITIGTGLTCGTMCVDVIRATGLRSTTPSLVGDPTDTVTLTIPPKTGGFLGSSGSGSNVTISNATRRFNDLFDSSYHRGYDYFNTTDIDQTVTFTRNPSGGSVRYRMFS